jgi:hypothetical protein
MQTHPETSDQTYAKQKEINEEWTQLTAKANSRKEKLLDSYDLQRFLSDYRDLMSWINSMMGLVSSDELANDVTGAEALLERHQVKIQENFTNVLFHMAAVGGINVLQQIRVMLKCSIFLKLLSYFFMHCSSCRTVCLTFDVRMLDISNAVSTPQWPNDRYI